MTNVGHFNKFLEAMDASEETGRLSNQEIWTALRLWVSFARAQDSIVAREQHSLTTHNLTRGEFAVLDALFFKGPLLLGDVQRKILVSSSGITYLIDRLEKRGLVQRQPSPDDRRAVYAALTDEGERYFKTIFPWHANGLAELFSSFTSEEQDLFLGLMQRLSSRAAELLEIDLNKESSDAAKTG